MEPLGGKRNPRTVRIVVAVIAIVVIVAGIASYIVLTRPAGTTCTLSSKDPLIFDQPETPDTLDPHVTFSTPGWGIVQQIYQSLVNYNGTKYTDYLGVLAKRWTVSPSGYNYTFTLRQDVHFSNGHQFNAFVMWFSLYRGSVMNQAGSFILQENFWYPGLTYYATAAQNRRAATQTAGYLNSFNFQNPVAADLAVMMAPDQSFRVIDRFTIELNMGYGYLGTVAYSFLLAAIAGPIASAVDPAVVRANGGVTVGGTNAFMATNMVGAGPYVVRTFNSATGYLIQTDPNYWAKNASAAEPSSNIISRAFNGKAQRWVGPVPPGYPYYNPGNLQPYPYDLNLAMQEMNQSRWKLPGGYPNTINYMYIKLGDWEQVALLLQSDLAKIGIRINPVGINNIDDLYTEQGRDNAGNCISQTTFSGGPVPIGQEFYTSDYNSPGELTPDNAINYTRAKDCTV